MPPPSTIAFWDPSGERLGLPTWPWRLAPAHLWTRAQLKARALRPAQPIQGQVLWRSRLARHRGGVRVAFLYDVRQARPVRIPTPAQRETLAKALAARRWCPRCERDAGYVLPARLGTCLDCATAFERAHAFRT